jgi:hypothetical protein
MLKKHLYLTYGNEYQLKSDSLCLSLVNSDLSVSTPKFKRLFSICKSSSMREYLLNKQIERVADERKGKVAEVLLPCYEVREQRKRNNGNINENVGSVDLLLLSSEDYLSINGSSRQTNTPTFVKSIYPLLESKNWHCEYNPMSYVFSPPSLISYILCTCQAFPGGIKDRPNSSPDAYHTCYSLAGMSICQNVGKYEYWKTTEKKFKENPINIKNGDSFSFESFILENIKTEQEIKTRAVELEEKEEKERLELLKKEKKKSKINVIKIAPTVHANFDENLQKTKKEKISESGKEEKIQDNINDEGTDKLLEYCFWDINLFMSQFEYEKGCCLNEIFYVEDNKNDNNKEKEKTRIKREGVIPDDYFNLYTISPFHNVGEDKVVFAHCFFQKKLKKMGLI